MALLMSDEELAAIRPAHVSMAAMWFWYAVRSGLVLSLAGIMAGTVVCPFLAPFEYLLVLSLAGLVLGLAGYVFVMVACFAQYSLRTMMLIVLATASLFALGTVLPEDLILVPVLAGIGWWFVLWVLIAKQDPAPNTLVVAPRFGIHSAAKAPSDTEPLA
ncbi:MAG: hypothetical protein L6R28_11490 [Planctomycetes bacterium]|nr:hypothetical protein [Planctomycetota bacterium]